MKNENLSKDENRKILEDDKKYFDYCEKFRKWWRKINFLKEQISKLEKSDDKISIISAFILKTIWIEFELKQLINYLDLYLKFEIYINTTPVIFSRKIRTPKELDDRSFTLGKLIEEINLYEGDFLKKLKENLPLLNKMRNKFIHRLFSAEEEILSLDELKKKAQENIKLANIILENIEEIHKFLYEKH